MTGTDGGRARDGLMVSCETANLWSRRRCVLAALLLVAIVVAPRIWAASRAVAPARDAFRYWSASTCLQQYPLALAAGWIDCQPLYPLTLAWIPGTGFGVDAETGWRTSQAWSVVCYTWFILAAYAAGAKIFGAPVAWLGCVFASVLPRQIRYSVDVLSDNLHAALWMTGFALLAWSWSERSRWALLSVAAAGLATGLAWWTRFEAILLPAAFTAAMLARQVFGADRPSWGRALLWTAAYLAPIALAIAAYAELRGGMVARTTVTSIVASTGRIERAAAAPDPLARRSETEFAAFLEPPRTPIDAWALSAGGAWSVAAVVGAVGRALWEFFQETRVWVGVLCAVGVAAAVVSKRVADRPLAFALSALLLCLAMAAVVRWRAGFLSGRYMTPVIPLAAMFAAAAVVDVRRRLDERRREWAALRYGKIRPATAWVAAVCVAAVSASAPGWIGRLHEDRQGHVAAAQWLRENSAEGECVFDPSWVCGFLAERPLWHPLQGSVPNFRYAVIEPSTAARPPVHLAESINFVRRHGRIAAEFPERPGGRRIGVRVIELPTADTVAGAPAKGGSRR